MKVSPEQILPSQNFLKPATIAFIFDCYASNRLENLPPAPLVRKDIDGNLIAIDGHNLIAVKLFWSEKVEIHLAHGPDDGLPPTTDANIDRNRDLKNKFETVLEDRCRVAEEGIGTFKDLLARYSAEFKQG